MKKKVKILITMKEFISNRSEMEFEFEGSITLKQLIDRLFEKYGEKFREELMDPADKKIKKIIFCWLMG